MNLSDKPHFQAQYTGVLLGSHSHNCNIRVVKYILSSIKKKTCFGSIVTVTIKLFTNVVNEFSVKKYMYKPECYIFRKGVYIYTGVKNVCMYRLYATLKFNTNIIKKTKYNQKPKR